MNVVLPALALVLGGWLNLSTVGGQVYPIGSVTAIVVMGVWIKVSLDKHFEELEERMKQDGGSREKEER